MKKLSTVFFFLFIFSGISFSQNIHIFAGGGYNFSHAPLTKINEFFSRYNEKPKVNNYHIATPFDDLHSLKGPVFCGGIIIQNSLIIEMCHTRKFNYSFAYYEKPTSPDYLTVCIGYKIGTLGFNFLAPYAISNRFSIAPGIGMDFVQRKLLYVHKYSEVEFNPTLKNFGVKAKKGTLGFSPMLQFSYKPIQNVPVNLNLRFYYQAMMSRMSVAWLDEIKNNWGDDPALLKVTGGNLGMSITAVVAIPPPHIRLPKPQPKPTPSPIYIPESIVVSGYITDEKTGKPVEALLVAQNKNNLSEKYNFICTNGFYRLELKNNNSYTFSFEALGYESKSEIVVLPNLTEPSITRNFTMKKLEIGQAITLNNIYFEKASAVLLPESFPELEKLFKFLSENETVEIEIAGHTSSEGGYDYNVKLSQDRAKSIQLYLINKGIKADRIKAKGYGPSVPVASNETEEGRKLNRRVEFKILKY